MFFDGDRLLLNPRRQMTIPLKKIAFFARVADDKKTSIRARLSITSGNPPCRQYSTPSSSTQRIPPPRLRSTAAFLASKPQGKWWKA
jgi:hypothetical protein